jgi:hypothetical protein
MPGVDKGKGDLLRLRRTGGSHQRASARETTGPPAVGEKGREIAGEFLDVVIPPPAQAAAGEFTSADARATNSRARSRPTSRAAGNGEYFMFTHRKIFFPLNRGGERERERVGERYPRRVVIHSRVLARNGVDGKRRRPPHIARSLVLALAFAARFYPV